MWQIVSSLEVEQSSLQGTDPVDDASAIIGHRAQPAGWYAFAERNSTGVK